MLDFACPNTISIQTSNIYLNQLQCQFAEVYNCTYATWNLNPKFPMSPFTKQLSIRPTCRDSLAYAIDHRCINKRAPVRTDGPVPCRHWEWDCLLEHLPSQADKRKTLTYDLLELSQRPHSCNDLSLRNSDVVQWFFDISIWKYTGTPYTQKVGSKTSFKAVAWRNYKFWAPCKGCKTYGHRAPSQRSN